MKKLAPIVLMFLTITVNAQEIFFTKTGHIRFFSETPIEDIEANNKKVNCAFDKQSGALEFKVRIKDFEFKKSLMQEHFNENYMESDSYPFAHFKGKITAFESLNLKESDKVPVDVEGIIAIHGVEQPIQVKGELLRAGESIKMNAAFHLRTADFNITIPRIVIKNIAEKIEVDVAVELKPLNKKQ